MQAPFQRDDDFLRDVEVARAEPDALHVWWLGQSGFLATHGGKTIVFDPYLSDSLTTKYAQTDKPHVRITGRVVAPERLSGVDLVTSSHFHTDHCDAETLKPLLRHNPTAALVIPEANRVLVAERLGLDHQFPTGLNDDDVTLVAGLKVHGLPAAHDVVERDHHSRCKYMGFVVELGPWKIYHAGDTRWVPGLPGRLRRLGIDVALLPINGALEERRVAGNLWGQEAAALAQAANARVAIPMHYDCFAFNTETPAAFIEACERRGQAYRVLRNGERASFARPAAG
jgi:L-ascorbate metabolism protein UlaG (beta-lactamase superfamily)